MIRHILPRTTVLGLTLLSIALNVLKPWPLALIVDSVLGSKPFPQAVPGFIRSWEPVAQVVDAWRIHSRIMLYVLEVVPPEALGDSATGRSYALNIRWDAAVERFWVARVSANTWHWVRTPEENPATRVADAVRAGGLPTFCLAGTDEEDSPCPALATTPGVHVARLPGSHHFNGDYAAVAEAVTQFIRQTSR